MNENDNIIATQVERPGPRWNWKDSHIVPVILPVVLTILFPGGGIFYLCGRFSPYPLTLWCVFMLYLAVIVFMVYCFVLGIMRLSGLRKKHRRNEKLLIIGGTSVPLIFFGLIIALFLFSEAMAYGPGPGLLIVGLRDRIETNVDVGATRVWLQSFRAEDYDDGYSRVSSDALPESLRVLKHASARLSADANGNAMVRLVWGSAMMGLVGVEIGMEDMKPSASDLMLYGEYKCRLLVEPGAYVFWRE